MFQGVYNLNRTVPPPGRQILGIENCRTAAFCRLEYQSVPERNLVSHLEVEGLKD